VQRADQRLLELPPVHHHVDHAVLEQELRALEARGQLLPNGLLDDAGSGETDEGPRLGDVEVAEHGVARRRSARRRIGQDGNERDPRLFQAGEGAARLGQLHQGQRAFLHPGPART
jgi:hypothetical protein